MALTRPKNGQGGMFEQPTDPALVATNGVDTLSKWLDNSVHPPVFKARNAANTAWEIVVTSGGDKNFTYTQSVASKTWNVNHGLNKIPSVTVIDTGGTEILGSVTYVDANNVTLGFSVPFSGSAYFN
jgi:hypothetical protein